MLKYSLPILTLSLALSITYPAHSRMSHCAEIFQFKDSVSTLVDLLRNDENFNQYLQGIREGKSLEQLRGNLNSIYSKSDKFKNHNLREVIVRALETEPVQTGKNKEIFNDKASKTILTKALQTLRNIKDLSARNIQQLRFLPESLKNAKKLINTELTQENLDEYVFDFYGYLNLRLKSSELRKWDKVEDGYKSVKMDDVVNLDPTTWAQISMLASEIEKPIDNYSDNSGEILRVASPQASRFMGKTTEEVEFLKRTSQSKRRNFCSNSWCIEESRHELTLSRVARAVAGRNLETSDIFDAYKGLDPLNMKDAYFHLLARNDTEWHAGSAYYFLGAHAKGDLGTWIGNVRKDEVKHQSIFGGLYKYLRGDTYWSRLSVMLKKSFHEIKQKSSKSDQSSIFKEAATAVEVIYIHALYEVQIRKFLKSIPLKTLRKVYETDISLTPLGSEPTEPMKEQKLKASIDRETVNRKSLARWPKVLRQKALALEEFEINHLALIDQLVRIKFKEFKGAETYNNSKHQEYLTLINGFNASNIKRNYGVILSSPEVKLLKQSLSSLIRDYQIFNNRSVREQNLNVEFVSVLRGFDIKKDENLNLAKRVK